MTKFADQLYADLMREHSEALRSLPGQADGGAAGSRRRAPRPAWLTVGIAAATGAVAGGFVLFGGAAAPAYAVTQNADGTLSVSVKQPSAIDAANATLKAMGVKVVVVPVRAGCPDLGSLAVTAPRSPQTPDTKVSVAVSGRDGAVNSITVDAKGVPSDETLVLAFENSGGGVFGGSALVKGAAPSCVSLPAPGAPGAPHGPGAPGAPGLGGSSGSGSTSGSSGSSGSGTTAG